MRISQRNLKRTPDTFLFISHKTNVLLFKFRCNIFISFRIIKEWPGSEVSGTLYSTRGHCLICLSDIRYRPTTGHVHTKSNRVNTVSIWCHYLYNAADMTLSAALIMHCLMTGRLVNSEQELVWKKAVVNRETLKYGKELGLQTEI